MSCRLSSLRRYLANLVADCCKYPHLAETVAAFPARLRKLATEADASVLVSQRVEMMGAGGRGGIVVAGSPDFPTCAEDQRVELTTLLDLPLRAVVFAAQIRTGMWCRNGGSMVDQLMNYRDVPYSKVYYDLDVTLLQVRTGMHARPSGTTPGALTSLPSFFHSPSRRAASRTALNLS